MKRRLAASLALLASTSLFLAAHVGAQPKAPVAPGKPKPKGAASATPSAAPSAAPSAVPSAAPAAPPSLGDTLTGQAKTEYDLGKILYRDGDFAHALEKFQKSYELSSEPRLLWNVAACEKNLRHYARLLKVLDQYLKDGEGKLTDQEKQDAKDLVDVVKPLVSTVKIEVNEPGAHVFIDDEDLGESPIAGARVIDSGPHKIRVEKSGFVPQARQETLTGNETTSFKFDLAKEVHEGTLVVDAGPKDAISIDGKAVAVAHYEARLPSGGHTLLVSAPGMRSYQAEVAIADNATRTIPITLDPLPSAGPPWLLIGGGGAALVAGLVVGGYFLFKPSPTPAPGTINPGTVNVGGAAFHFGGRR